VQRVVMYGSKTWLIKVEVKFDRTESRTRTSYVGLHTKRK